MADTLRKVTAAVGFPKQNLIVGGVIEGACG